MLEKLVLKCLPGESRHPANCLVNSGLKWWRGVLNSTRSGRGLHELGACEGCRLSAKNVLYMLNLKKWLDLPRISLMIQWILILTWELSGASLLPLFSLQRCTPFSFTLCLRPVLWNKEESESESCSVMSDSLRPHGLYSPWNSPT